MQHVGTEAGNKDRVRRTHEVRSVDHCVHGRDNLGRDWKVSSSRRQIGSVHDGGRTSFQLSY